MSNFPKLPHQSYSLNALSHFCRLRTKIAFYSCHCGRAKKAWRDGAGIDFSSASSILNEVKNLHFFLMFPEIYMFLNKILLQIGKLFLCLPF